MSEPEKSTQLTGARMLDTMKLWYPRYSCEPEMNLLGAGTVNGGVPSVEIPRFVGSVPMWIDAMSVMGGEN